VVGILEHRNEILFSVEVKKCVEGLSYCVVSGFRRGVNEISLFWNVTQRMLLGLLDPEDGTDKLSPNVGK
jgi:hypothetical protein